MLVAYYSRSGHTERVARSIAARFGADLGRVREGTSRRGLIGYLRALFDSWRERPARLEAGPPLAHEHRLIVIGTPIWAGKMTPAIRAYLASLRGRSGHVALFTTSAATNGAAVITAMEVLLGKTAVASVCFTERELRDPVAYETKLGAFQVALEGRGESLASAVGAAPPPVIAIAR